MNGTSRADAGWRWWVRGLGSALILGYLAGYTLGVHPPDAMLFTGTALVGGEALNLGATRQREKEGA